MKTMKTNKPFLTPAFAGLAVLAALALLTCRNPLLSVGLGDKVDITPPGIRLIDSDGIQNGAYVHGTITIKGESADDIGVQSVSWTVTDTKSGESSQPALAGLDEARKNWSFQLNTAQAGTLYRDGEKSFVFTVTDGAGKTTETRMLLIFDNGAPVAMVNLPSSETDPLNATVRLSGEAYDQFGVQSVTVKLFNTATGGTPLNGASGATADGTNTWNYSFNSTTLTAGAGTFWFQITVEDRAGNRSAHQYLYTDVFAANANKQFTVDKLALLESGAVASYDSIDASELTALQKARQQMAIDQNSDKPTFIISSPLPSDIVGFNSRFVGLVNDDDGVRNGVSDIKAHVWKADNSLDFGWGDAAPAGSGLSVRFSYALNMISTSGDYKVEVQATDIYGTPSTSTPVIFTVDAGIPAVNINALARVYFNEYETLHLTGTAQSIGGQVNKVELAIGATKVLASLGSLNAENTTWTGDFPLAGITEAPTPNKTLVVEATDDHLGMPKIGSTNMFLIIDNTAPQARFVSPSNGATVYNQVTLRGTSSDNSSLTKVELRIGKAAAGSGFVEITGSLYDWTKDFLSNDYTNSTQSTDRGDGTWSLPIYCRVYDVAGNVSTNEPSNPADPLYPSALATLYGSALSFNPANVPVFSLVIDLDRDKPTITIQTPRDGTNVAGTVVASGSCFDESPGMDTVEIQVAALRDDDSLIGYVTPGGAAQGAPGWIIVPWIGGQRSYWQQSLNENEKLYNVGAVGGAYPLETLHHGKLRVSVRPTDLGAKVGNVQTVTFRLDDTIPRLEAPKVTLNGIDVAAVDYLYARGTIRLKARASDNLQVTSIKISMNGGSSYGGEQIGGSYVDPAAPAKDLDLDYPIDTLTDPQIPAAVRTAKNGLLTLGVKVQDNANPAPYVNTWFVTLNVDNIYPLGAYTGAAADIHGSGADATLQGTATDAGSVSGIQQIHLYFVRGGNVYNHTTDAFVPIAMSDFGTDGGGMAPWTAILSEKVVIDSRTELGNDGGAGGDGDGFNESLTLAGSTYNWWAKFDSAVIPDGAVDIHYVVFDNAGNGHHYLQAGFIKNHKPSISSVDVGSDLDASDDVESDERFAYSTPIKARNRLYIGINATDDKGGLSYAVYHDPAGANTLVQSVAVGTINITAYAEGPTSFLCRVTDSDGIQQESTIGVTIENLDTVDPGITLNTPAQGDAPSGHIELEGDSLYDGTDPDVSGTLILRGTASDEQRLAALTVTITSFDAGSGIGVERTVASWSGGMLTSTDANFALTSQSLTESGGHQVAWTYTWNTAGVTNSAAQNINVSFKAQDFSSPTPRTATSFRTHDVVPYVKTVSTQTGGIKDGNIRSALGRYSIRQNLVNNADLITLSGYNLRPIANGVRVSSDPDGLVGATLQGASLTVEGASSPWTTLTMRKNSNRSGYLTVVAGAAGAPVPSLNNVNQNTRTYNQEPDIYSMNYLLTDDRYLNLFAVTKTAYTNGYYPAMVMNGDTPVFAYCNDTTGNTLRDGTVIANGWYHRMNALARDSSGNYYHASVHDAFGGGYGHLNLFYNAFGGNAWPFGNPGPYSTSNTNNALALDNLTFMATKLNRYHYPKLVVNGTSASTQVYLGYYDDETSAKDLIIRVFQIGTAVTNTRALAGGVWSNQVEAAGDGTAGTAGTENGRNVVAGSASQYFDMGLTGTGVLVVVYYDEAANQLKFSYNATPVNGNGRYGGSFAAPLSLDTTYNGTYVSLAVDSANHIHIAYYDSADADLKYIYLDSYLDTTPSIALVDAYHSVGPWTDIRATSAGVPYIAYYNNSENGTRDSVKLAHYLGSLPTVSDGVDGSGAVTGSWECVTVPVRDVPQGGLPQFNQVNLGFDSSGDPTLGYLADAIEYSNYLPEIP